MSTTFLYRYETGWQSKDGTLENCAEYFSKKVDAMNFALATFERIEARSPDYLASTYVYDRCLDLTRWYDGTRWTRKQPIAWFLVDLPFEPPQFLKSSSMRRPPGTLTN